MYIDYSAKSDLRGNKTLGSDSKRENHKMKWLSLRKKNKNKQQTRFPHINAVPPSPLPLQDRGDFQCLVPLLLLTQGFCFSLAPKQEEPRGPYEHNRSTTSEPNSVTLLTPVTQLAEETSHK